MKILFWNAVNEFSYSRSNIVIVKRWRQLRVGWIENDSSSSSLDENIPQSYHTFRIGRYLIIERWFVFSPIDQLSLGQKSFLLFRPTTLAESHNKAKDKRPILCWFFKSKIEFSIFSRKRKFWISRFVKSLKKTHFKKPCVVKKIQLDVVFFIILV